MGHKLAIDFGTTNSVVARWDEQARAADFVFPSPPPSASPQRGEGADSLPLVGGGLG
ncbi:MAG: hypothetical protein JW850_19915 [Thermoflexales bacterium]|nr:hypothetical protein [Thermoflexales bacterium]